MPGTVWVDGALFSTALTDTLRQLEPTRLGMTKAEKAQRREEFDRRQPYAFRAHGKLDADFGSQRRKGPALAGAVRCPNVPAPLRLALAVFAAGAGLLSLMARRAVRYSFPLIVLLALPGAVALCQNFPSVRRALERQQARLPWLLMAALLGVVAARVWFDGHAYRFVNLL